MIKLFIDTSYDVFIGLLSTDGTWEGKSILKGFKASQILQKEIYSLLLQKNLPISSIDSIITSSGPGFYTGMRLSEGVADVFRLKGLKHYSYYNFMLPKWYGHNAGLWMTKAYRGEYFFYLWNNQEEEKYLLKESDLEEHFEKWNILNIPFFIHQESAIDEKLKKYIKSYQETVSFIESTPEKLFHEVIQSNRQAPSYYFRAPEDEFRPSL